MAIPTKDTVEELISSIDVNNPHYIGAIEELTNIYVEYCQQTNNVELLSWIFTASLVRKCFDLSMKTIDKKGKQVISEFLNQICGVDSSDASTVEGQCECLVGAIVNGDENTLRHNIGMELFISWMKDGERKETFENSTLMRMSKSYLSGTWPLVRKVRFVRLIRKLIERGLFTAGMTEIFEEGCALLSEMEKGRFKEEEEDQETEEYINELYLLKLRGIQKRMKQDGVEEEKKADEVEEVKRELEEARRNAEMNKQVIARLNYELEELEKTNAFVGGFYAMQVARLQKENDDIAKERDEEKRKREEAEQKNKQLEEKLRSMEMLKEEKRMKENVKSRITSLDATVVSIPKPAGLQREGNTLTYNGPSHQNRLCFIGGVMTSGIYQITFIIRGQRAVDTYPTLFLRDASLWSFTDRLKMEPNGRVWIHNGTTNHFDNEIVNIGDEWSMEVDLRSEEKEKRTLHWFVRGKQQKGFIKGLPDRVEFGTKLAFPNVAIDFVSLKELTSPTVVEGIKGEKGLEW